MVIPDSVTTIGGGAFSYTAYFNNQENWENGVLYIGKYLIAADSAISAEYAIKDDTLLIGNAAFGGCSGLTSVVIGENVTAIGDYAFDGCGNLASVVIGENVTSIGEDAFWGCGNLTSVYYTGDVAGWCNIDFGSNYANPLVYADNWYINNQLITELVIPDGVKMVKNYAFRGYSGLTSVTIGDDVTIISDAAFSKCSNLASVVIGDSVTFIGEFVFNGCTSLTSITFTGTMGQWNNITKVETWKNEVPANQVVCSDGAVGI